MENLYDLLEIPKEASKSDVKRAYFKMIKIYSPEKNPEKFKLIRKAYDRLYDDSLREEYDKNLNVSDKFSKEFLICKEYIHNLQYKEALNLLLDLREYHKDEIDIEITLAQVYLFLGNSTKAINVIEPLYKKHEKNETLSYLLAKCYDKRGFNKKANAQYKQAILLDETNSKLWVDYIMFCDRTDSESVVSLIKKAESIKKNMFLNDFAIYSIPINFYHFEHRNKNGLIFLKKYIECYNLQKKIDQKHYKTILNFVDKLSDVSEFKEDLEKFLLNLNDYQFKEKEDIKKIEEIKNNLKNLEFYNDKKIHESLKSLTRILLDGCGSEDFTLDRFSFEFTVIGELPVGIKKSILHMKSAYPDLYKLNFHFYNDILNPKREPSIITKYINEYRQLRKKYPDYFDDDLNDFFDDDLNSYFDDEIAFDDSLNEPYVKSSPKIGRNKPCPCGSGKKYKNCCGK